LQLKCLLYIQTNISVVVLTAFACVFGCAKPLGIISAVHKKQSLSCLLQTFLPVTYRPGRQKAAV